MRCRTVVVMMTRERRHRDRERERGRTDSPEMGMPAESIVCIKTIFFIYYYIIYITVCDALSIKYLFFISILLYSLLCVLKYNTYYIILLSIVYFFQQQKRRQIVYTTISRLFTLSLVLHTTSCGSKN